MNAINPIAPPIPSAHEWHSRVLTGFSQAELAIGRLCAASGLSIERGTLSNLAALRSRLKAVGCKRCKVLDARIERWCSYRGHRHLLAHGTIVRLFDERGKEVILTRHLPRDRDDLTHDRMWTLEERAELLRIATNDGRSINDQVRNIMADGVVMKRLATP